MVTTPLRQRMIQALTIRNLFSKTTRIHISLVSRFALFFHRAPDRLDLPDIERYLFFLRDEKRVSYCLFNQTVCALRFFYLHVMNRPDLVLRIPYGRREKHYPVVLSVDEMLAVLAQLRSLRDRAVITVLYSAGLRLGEVCRLRVENIDSARMLLHVRQARSFVQPNSLPHLDVSVRRRFVVDTPTLFATMSDVADAVKSPMS